MRDEAFTVFIEEFGEATYHVEVTDAALQMWRGKLPDRLLSYWRHEGWCDYSNGLFWTVNPGEYEDLVDAWLKDSPLEGIDTFHVIARSAFGLLYVWGETTGRSAKIECATHALFALKSALRKKSLENLDISILAFFGLGKDDCDLGDDFGEPLFDRALEKLGPLAPDEMYGFEPAIVLGGKMLLENLHKVKLDQHLTLLRQLAAPTMPLNHEPETF